ncbi:hypothetical protein BCU70_19425 [Vibrio sp. 10N.286.49.C2]|uniref:hypothetical protein n=1 Tax=unclassified Vibrio TaxID=2614977 RepID=UPI000C8209AF|nr:hypothetical protein [Vibrio sp. 10N.286.48.B7]PMH34833.1 hypothetical protein BCU70_19425 [Vibrio sp. 10N.286.49.C2]PMH51379.1 hypothetical protein BCU66_16690 [Vibrio sp. 10N.286.49.B1]PMH83630.1 hypothetical protein BCU58_14165 [Vibrio sp. 10N.286.48.B7]
MSKALSDVSQVFKSYGLKCDSYKDLEKDYELQMTYQKWQLLVHKKTNDSVTATSEKLVSAND